MAKEKAKKPENESFPDDIPSMARQSRASGVIWDVFPYSTTEGEVHNDGAPF